MLLDQQEALSNAQVLAGAGVSVSANKYDTGMATSKFGAGKSIGIGIFAKVGAVGPGETYTVSLVSDSDPLLATPAVHATRVFTAAELAFGAKHFLALGPNDDIEKFIGARVTLAGVAPAVTLDIHLMTFEAFTVTKAYPNAY